MEVIAKSHYPKHLHQAGGVKMQFGPTGIFRTSNKKEIAILEKQDGLNGRWNIVDRIYTPDEQKAIDAKNKREDDAAKKAARDLLVKQVAEDGERTKLRMKSLELGVEGFMEMSINEMHRAINVATDKNTAAQALVDEKEKKDGVNEKKAGEK